MKGLLFILLVILWPQVCAQTAPPAPPTILAADFGSSSGSTAKWGVLPTGAAWAGYTYVARGERRLVVICRLPGFVPVNVPVNGMTPIAHARATWIANVRTDCRTDPAMRHLWLAAKEAFRE